MSSEEKSPIAEWYNGQTIFITGGTGFMGKVLIEKLLYTSPNVKAIYVLMRSKRGKSPQARLDDILKLPMWTRLKNKPSLLEKIIPINGDVISDNLGLSASDEQLLINNVNIVFHCAATLKLEADLKDSIAMNTEGTKKTLDLAKKMKNLKVFLHLSTAFCSVDIDEFEERVYRTSDNPYDIIEVAKWINNDALIAATPSLIKPHPNTYTFSKRLAETLVADVWDETDMKLLIVRPSIVTPAGIEPIPGWVDTLNGPMGIIVGAGKGVIRSMHCKGENRAQSIPVDMAISAMLVSAYKLGITQERPKEMPVYNLTNDEVLPETWGNVLNIGRKVAYDYPFEMMVWYPDGDIRSSKFIHNLYCIFVHWLPAYLIDFLMLIFGQKRFMIRIQTKVAQGLELLQFFTVRNWIFKSQNFLNLWNSKNFMTKKDKELYNMDFFQLPIEEYFTRCILGTRQYCMKEPLSSLPRCRIQQKFMYVLHKLFVYSLYLSLFYLVVSWSGLARRMSDYAEIYDGGNDVPIKSEL